MYRLTEKVYLDIFRTDVVSLAFHWWSSPPSVHWKEKHLFQDTVAKDLLIQVFEGEALHGATKKKIADYLTKVIKPAGMNFPELRNLSPITTIRVPELPAFPQWEGKQSLPCAVSKSAVGLSQFQQHKLAHLEKARHSWDFEMPDKHRLQPAGQTGALQPERWRCLWSKHRFHLKIYRGIKVDKWNYLHFPECLLTSQGKNRVNCTHEHLAIMQHPY